MDFRERLLAGAPVADRRRVIAGVRTAVLQGGAGAPLVLLHGPGESAAGWGPVLDRLTATHAVVAPDLPGHGDSELPVSPGGDGPVLSVPWLLEWFDELISATCPVPPVAVGRVVGGAIAARYAIARPDRLAGVVLVDSLGLAPFDPDPRFGLAMRRFQADPTAATYERFMEFCAYDLDAARTRMGAQWPPYAGYAVQRATDPRTQAATDALLAAFAAPLPAAELAALDVPTSMIWGREDLALPLAIAEAARDRFRWPLAVVDGAGDDPPLDQPDRFVDVLLTTLDRFAATPAPGVRA
jgi:pimeloyl-ACP methyl ester carboxylesterase